MKTVQPVFYNSVAVYLATDSPAFRNTGRNVSLSITRTFVGIDVRFFAITPVKFTIYYLKYIICSLERFYRVLCSQLPKYY